jgi:hypothetical protein
VPVIVVGVDGSHCSLRACAYASGLAIRQEGRLVVVPLVQPPLYWFIGSDSGWLVEEGPYRRLDTVTTAEVAGACKIAEPHTDAHVITGSKPAHSPVSAPRGACTACGAFYALTPDGIVRAHADLASHSRCAGSGRRRS